MIPITEHDTAIAAGAIELTTAEERGEAPREVPTGTLAEVQIDLLSDLICESPPRYAPPAWRRRSPSGPVDTGSGPERTEA